MDSSSTVRFLNKMAEECLADNLCDMGNPVVLHGELNLQVFPKGQDAFMLEPPSKLDLEAQTYPMNVTEEPGIIRVIVQYSLAKKLLNLQNNFYINYFLALSNQVLMTASKYYELDSNKTLITAKRPGQIGNEGYFRELENMAGYEIRFYIKPNPLVKEK